MRASSKFCKIFTAALLLSGMAVSGAVEPLSPTGGETVVLLTDAQRQIMSVETYDERLAALRKDRENGGGIYFDGKDTKWRKAKPLVFSWRATGGEIGPWKIVQGKDTSFAEALTWWVEDKDIKAEKQDGGVVCKWEVPRPNLLLGRTYCWKVWSDVKCTKGHVHGSMLSGSCAICGEKSKVRESPVAVFSTDSQPPRWISLEGRVGNIRDLGGWKTVDRRRVRQGLVFRGQGLNDNSPNGDRPGRNRLMVEDVAYLRNVLRIKTDLDLRNSREVAGMNRSPIGDGINYIQRASPLYDGIFEEAADKPDWAGAEGKKTMAANFRVFCDERNYPIYFHCIGGADRTGSLAYVLNGILGVSRHDLEIDWESTFYPVLPELEPNYNGPKYWRRKQYLDEGFLKYGGPETQWNERIRLYLLDCGVTEDEIEKFRSIMLEPLPVSTQPQSCIGMKRPWDPSPGWWEKRHAEKLAQIAASGGEIDLVFVGDSITHNWEGARGPGSDLGGKPLAELKKKYSVLNLGFGGDSTRNVLWRLENGELDGYKAKCFMLMIGTNNGDKRPEDTAAGIKAILDLIARKQPQAKTILLPVFPSGATADHPWRRSKEKINALIKDFADGDKVVWCDFNARFLNPDGTFPKGMMMKDDLHPLAPGYDIWAEEVAPLFRRICGK